MKKDLEKRKLTDYIKTGLKFLNVFDYVWLISFCLLSIIISIVTKDTVLALLTALTGLVCEILVCERTRVNFIFSILNDIGCAIIAFEAKYYAGGLVNLVFWLPNDIISIILWKRHKEENSQRTNVRSFKWWQFSLFFIVVMTVSYPLGLFLEWLGDAEGYLDALCSILEIASGLLIMFRIRGQYIVWFTAIIIQIVLYTIATEWLIVIMNIGYLVSSAYGLYTWTKNIKAQKATSQPITI